METNRATIALNTVSGGKCQYIQNFALKRSEEIYDTETIDRVEMIQEMKKYFSEEPEVGLFWYDNKNDELFEVHSIPISRLKSDSTTHPKLHKTIWQSLKMKALHKRDLKKEYNPIYLNDYTVVPRGRVFYKNGVFYIVTGNWINDNTDYIVQLIIDEFNLQDQKVKLKYDSHWDIGHGWSTERDEFEFEFD